MPDKTNKKKAIKKSADRKNTRERIIRIASFHIAQYGYRRTTLRSIAELCKIEHASLFYHFHSKQDLMERCMDYWFDNFETLVLTPALEEAKSNPGFNNRSEIRLQRFSQRLKTYLTHTYYDSLLDHFRWLSKVELNLKTKINLHFSKWITAFNSLGLPDTYFAKMLSMVAITSIYEKDRNKHIEQFCYEIASLQPSNKKLEKEVL